MKEDFLKEAIMIFDDFFEDGVLSCPYCKKPICFPINKANEFRNQDFHKCSFCGKIIKLKNNAE